MIIELHSHTAEHSTCSKVSAKEVVNRCFQQDLQGVVLTDHHYQWDEAELADLARQCSVPDSFVILSGQEVRTSDFGDVLVYGARESIAEGICLPEIKQRFPMAALIWAHPYRNGRRPTASDLQHPCLDAVEIFNSNHTVSENIRGLQEWHHFRFTATAGTDLHALSYSGTYTTLFDHPIHSIMELAQEIRMGRCRPNFKEIPRYGTSQTRVTEVKLGDHGKTASAEKLIVRSHLDYPTWRVGRRSHHIMSAIAAHGFRQGIYRIPESLGQDENSLTLIEQGVDGISLYDKLLQVYLKAIARKEKDFMAQVALFRARTALSMIYYLVKVGLGESENLWRVMVSAEKALVQVEEWNYI